MAVAQTFFGHILQGAYAEYENGKTILHAGPHNIQLLK
jgi:hypothetical protein